jgi:WD40 repeat protein
MAGSSKNREKIVAGIRELTGFGISEICSAQVSAVDEGTTTMDVLINDNLLIHDVRLRSVIDNTDGLYVIPSIDSYVVIGKIDGGVDYVLIKASKIDKVMINIGGKSLVVDTNGFVFNGGNHDGLVKIQELTTKLNNLENKFNDLLTAIQGIVVPLAPSGTYPFAPSFAAISPLAQTVQTDIENPDIKH